MPVRRTRHWTRFWAPVADRLTYVRGSVLDAGLLADIAERQRPDRIVHAATVTSVRARDARRRAIANPETDVPDKVLEVNIMGTVRLLELARTLPGLNADQSQLRRRLQRLRPRAARPDARGGLGRSARILRHLEIFQRDDRPPTAAFRLPVASAGLSGVYGPMDRWRPSRAYIARPRCAAPRAGRPAGAHQRPDGVGDHIHAQDVARAMGASGKAGRVRPSRLQRRAGRGGDPGRTGRPCNSEIIPGLRWELAPPEACDIVCDPRYAGGRWGAYDIGRHHDETGWTPMPLRQALADYAAFIDEFGVTA